MSLLVVVLLAVLWAAVLLPGALRGRRSASPMGSIDSFERSMVMLAHRSQSSAPAAGRQVLLPPPPTLTPRRRAAQRRRTVLARLGLAAVASALVALVAGGLAWVLFGATAAALGGYVYMLVQLETRQHERRRKVRRLPQHDRAGRRALDLHELAVVEPGGRR